MTNWISTVYKEHGLQAALITGAAIAAIVIGASLALDIDAATLWGWVNDYLGQ